MKCTKCDLVTFDHLPRCPSCNASFRLNRVLTGRRRDPNRRILLPPVLPVPADEAAVEVPVDSIPVDSVSVDSVPVDTIPVEVRVNVPVDIPPEVAGLPTTPEPAMPYRPSCIDLSPGLPAPESPLTREPVLTSTPPGDGAHEAHRESHATLSQLAAAERRGILAATHGHRAGSPTSPASGSADRRTGNADERDAHALKKRMMRASRARRKLRPDLVAETVDPILPGWYDPGIEKLAGEPVTAGSLTDR